jgi:hypothetical protein
VDTVVFTAGAGAVLRHSRPPGLASRLEYESLGIRRGTPDGTEDGTVTLIRLGGRWRATAPVPVRVMWDGGGRGGLEWRGWRGRREAGGGRWGAAPRPLGLGS